MSNFFFQAEDGIRDGHVTGVRRVLFRSSPRLADLGPGGQDGRLLESDRSGGGLAGPRAVRGAGRLQVVRARPDRLLRRLRWRSEEHTSELQSRGHLVCRLLLEKKKPNTDTTSRACVAQT